MTFLLTCIIPGTPQPQGSKRNVGGNRFIEANKNTQLDVVSGVPRSKMWAEVVKPAGYDPMLANSKKASEVLADVDAKLNKLLDEYWAANK